jgi:hypothetical protein
MRILLARCATGTGLDPRPSGSYLPPTRTRTRTHLMLLAHAHAH